MRSIFKGLIDQIIQNIDFREHLLYYGKTVYFSNDFYFLNENEHIC